MQSRAQMCCLPLVAVGRVCRAVGKQLAGSAPVAAVTANCARAVLAGQQRCKEKKNVQWPLFLGCVEGIALARLVTKRVHKIKFAFHHPILLPVASTSLRSCFGSNVPTSFTMAVPAVLGDYIVKNYKRLLICVAPPAESVESADDADDDDTVRIHASDDANRPRRRHSSNTRVRSSRSVRRAERTAVAASASGSTTRPPDAERSDEEEPFVSHHEGPRMVRGRWFHRFRAYSCRRVLWRYSFETFADDCLCSRLCRYYPLTQRTHSEGACSRASQKGRVARVTSLSWAVCRSERAESFLSCSM